MKKGKILTNLLYIPLLLLIVLCFLVTIKTFDANKYVEEFKSQIPTVSYAAGEEKNNSDSNIAVEAVTLVRVVDGDTVVVDTATARNIKVRLIGVNSPESVSPDESQNTAEGRAASEFTKSKLKVGNTYYLEYDKDREDDYGRTLAYLWLVDCSKTEINEQFVRENMFNAILLKSGYARTMKIAPNTKYADIFAKIEKETRKV